MSNPRPVKSQAFVFDTTLRRSAVDWENQNHIDNQEKYHISLGGQHLIIYKFFKGFTNNKKKTNMVVVFTLDLFPMFLINTGATVETFQQSGK